MTGLFAENGPVRYLRFFAENKGSFSILLIVFYVFFVRHFGRSGSRSVALGLQQGQVVLQAVVEHRRHAVRGLRSARNGIHLVRGVLVIVQILGICSALAVTVQLKPAIVMALSVTVVTGKRRL